MKAWEILKNLQEGKKLRQRSWKEWQYIKLTSDIHGSLGVVSESGEGFSVGEFLEDDDGWEEYKQKKKNVKAEELFKEEYDKCTAVDVSELNDWKGYEPTD